MALSLLAQSPLLSEAYIGGGGFISGERPMGIAEWRTLLPGSALLRGDVPRNDFQGTGRRYSGYYGSFPGWDIDDAGEGAGSVSLGVGLNLWRGAEEGARYEKRLRIGFNGLGETWRADDWQRLKSAPYDTLVSSATGDLYVLDSIWTETYSASASWTRLALDGSFIVRRISQRRVTWLVGGGILLGTAINGTASVERRIRRWRETVSRDVSDLESSGLGEESFPLPASFLGMAYGIIGIDIRLGRESPFWSALHLTYEARPGLLLSSMPSLGMRADRATQHLLGLRIDLR